MVEQRGLTLGYGFESHHDSKERQEHGSDQPSVLSSVADNQLLKSDKAHSPWWA